MHLPPSKQVSRGVSILADRPLRSALAWYAMGGVPLMAIAILGWPVNKVPPEVAGRVVEGGPRRRGSHGLLLPWRVFCCFIFSWCCRLFLTGRVFQMVKKEIFTICSSKITLADPPPLGGPLEIGQADFGWLQSSPREYVTSLTTGLP